MSTTIVDPYRDAKGKWAAFLRGGFNWRWFTFPHLYYPPGLRYKKVEKFTFHDALGRQLEYDRAFDCTISPDNGRLETLYVQATDSICQMSATQPNCTWKRTPIRNVSPWFLRISNLPFSLIEPERRNDPSKYTSEDYATIVAMWIPTIIALMFSLTMNLMPTSRGRPAGKSADNYLPLPYGDLRFPRLARNYRENREGVIRQGHATPAWSLAAKGSYRTYRPKFLYFIRETLDKHGNLSIRHERCTISQRDNIPYLFLSWSWAHYPVRPGHPGEEIDPDVHEQLLASALQAAMEYYIRKNGEESLDGKAFWISAGCLSAEHEIDLNGKVVPLDPNDPEYIKKKREEANKDTYSISDIIRGAEHVVVLSWSGTAPRNPGNDDALRVWGQQVWTLPEVILSKGDHITVAHMHFDRQTQMVSLDEFEPIAKTDFPYRAWNDHNIARQLMENYTNLHLSRLELVKTALECIMSRQFRQAYPGDRTYALMGLFRIRPPIDRTDSSFQAFARMSFPEDNDQLMERLICLLPKSANENWELMNDQYESSLWDIYPKIQVSAVGENDTVVIEGALGAQIQWSNFHELNTTKRAGFKRSLFVSMVVMTPAAFFLALAITAFIPFIGIPFLMLVLIFLILPSPWYVWTAYGGKLWSVEPAFFGIEGFVPVEVIEENLFGVRRNRMKWSAFGSPLSRHKEGAPVHERNAAALGSDAETGALLPQTVDTYPVVPISPCAPCEACGGDDRSRSRFTMCNNHETYISSQQKSGSDMGEMKVFTLVNTLDMSVTVFHAVRPPTALVVCSTEGGMKRAIACSLDVTTGTLYRETVLRIPSECVDHMYHIPRIRLGLRRPFHRADLEGVAWSSGVQNISPQVPVPQPSGKVVAHSDVLPIKGDGWSGQSGHQMHQLLNRT